jgi:hypothetical protein
LDTGEIEHIKDERRLVDLLHDGEKLGIDVLEPGAFDWKEVFDVCTSRKDPFEVDPLSLNIDPDILQSQLDTLIVEKYSPNRT